MSGAEVFAQVPIYIAATALLSVGGALMRLRQLDKALEKVPSKDEVKNVVDSLDRLSKEVSKLSDSSLADLQRRMNAAEVWMAGHDQQARERWEQVRPKGHE